VSREPYDPQESCAASLRSIDETLEIIAEAVAGTASIKTQRAIEREREDLLDAIISAFSRKRYRNIVFDGMDTVRTAVVPLASVEMILEQAFGRPWKTVTLPAKPAGGEKEREDRTT
jgi:hypothetical protein